MLSNIAPLLAYFLSYPVMIIALWRVEIGIIFFVTLIPVIAAMQKIAEYPGGNNIADLLIVSMIIGWFWTAAKESRNIFISSPINAAVALVIVGSFMSFFIGSTIMSFSSEVNLIRLKALKNFMILPTLYFIVANNLRSEKSIKIMIFCICLTMLATDFNFYSTFKWIKQFHYSHDLRISGAFTFLGPNEMGIFYAMNVFLLISISYFIENKKLRYFILFTSVISFYPVIYSYSRTAYLCALTGLLTLGLLKDNRLFILLIVIILIYRIILPNSVIERIDMTMLDKGEISEDVQKRSSFEIGGTNIEITGRKELWRKALNYFYQHPILGNGFLTFRHLEGAIPHGLYHKLLAERGLVGLSIHIYFLLTIFKQSYRLYRFGRSKLGQGIGLGLLTSSILYAVGTISGDISLYYNLMVIFWLFLGLVSRSSLSR